MKSGMNRLSNSRFSENSGCAFERKGSANEKRDPTGKENIFKPEFNLGLAKDAARSTDRFYNAAAVQRTLAEESNGPVVQCSPYQGTDMGHFDRMLMRTISDLTMQTLEDTLAGGKPSDHDHGTVETELSPSESALDEPKYIRTNPCHKDHCEKPSRLEPDTSFYKGGIVRGRMNKYGDKVAQLQAEVERLNGEKEALTQTVQCLENIELSLLSSLEESECKATHLQGETARLEDVKDITYKEMKGLLVLQHEEAERLRRKVELLERQRTLMAVGACASVAVAAGIVAITGVGENLFINL